MVLKCRRKERPAGTLRFWIVHHWILNMPMDLQAIPGSMLRQKATRCRKTSKPVLVSRKAGATRLLFSIAEPPLLTTNSLGNRDHSRALFANKTKLHIAVFALKLTTIPKDLPQDSLCHRDFLLSGIAESTGFCISRKGKVEENEI